MTYLKQQAFNLRKEGLTKSEISRRLNIPRTTIRRWLENVGGVVNSPEAESCVGTTKTVSEIDLLKDKVRTLQTSINAANKESLTDHYVREKIIGLAELKPEPPKWLLDLEDVGDWQAVPTLLVSDWHWGEVVDKNQIGGVNTYDIDVAHERVKALVETTCKLLDMVGGDYPGIVVAQGGDAFSGSIHDELTETNEAPMMPVFLDLYETSIWMLEQFANKFGNVFVPCVTGNHSRTTHKPRHKQRNFLNFDWLLYTLLEKHFENDPRVVFQIPDGPDALFKIFNTRYLLTHGDQFRTSGDSMIGALGTIIRGDHKKRGRNNQIQMGYDVLLLGHWHQLIQMQRVIVNGSLKGYDEYAYTNNFGYEQPRQALWLTHPDHGIIMSMPVNVDREHDERVECLSEAWVSWRP